MLKIQSTTNLNLKFCVSASFSLLLILFVPNLLGQEVRRG